MGLSPLAGERNGIISRSWFNMSPYWRWVAELYYVDMVRKYGQLAAVDREFMLAAWCGKDFEGGEV